MVEIYPLNQHYWTRVQGFYRSLAWLQTFRTQPRTKNQNIWMSSHIFLFTKTLLILALGIPNRLAGPKTTYFWMIGIYKPFVQSEYLNVSWVTSATSINRADRTHRAAGFHWAEVNETTVSKHFQTLKFVVSKNVVPSPILIPMFLRLEATWRCVVYTHFTFFNFWKEKIRANLFPFPFLYWFVASKFVTLH